MNDKPPFLDRLKEWVAIALAILLVSALTAWFQERFKRDPLPLPPPPIPTTIVIQPDLWGGEPSVYIIPHK